MGSADPGSLLLSSQQSAALRKLQRAKVLTITLNTRPMGTLPGNLVRETAVGFPIQCGNAMVVFLPTQLAAQPTGVEVRSANNQILPSRYRGILEADKLSVIQLLGETVQPAKVSTVQEPDALALSLTGLFPGSPGVLSRVEQWKDSEGMWRSSLTLADGTWIFDDEGALQSIPTRVSSDKQSSEILPARRIIELCKEAELPLTPPGKQGNSSPP